MLDPRKKILQSSFNSVFGDVTLVGKMAGGGEENLIMKVFTKQ